MEKKRKSFLKQYQFLLLVVFMGCIFFTVMKRWDIYVVPANQVKTYVQEFLGLEVAAGEEKQGADKHGQGGSGDLGPDGKGAGLPEGHDGKKEELPEDGGEIRSDNKEQESGGEEGPSEPKYVTVDDSYFDDALFIGDSRVVGLRDYGKLDGHGTFYANEGLNVFRLLSAKIVTVPGRRGKITVDEALQQNQFAKIYLMVGINELDIGTVDGFQEKYQETVDRIRELQPNARIIIQSIMLVTERRAAKGDFVTNSAIMERNEAIKSIADGEHVFYLDVNEAIVDESGCMNPSYTTDGIHLKAKYIPLWTDYLKTHVME